MGLGEKKREKDVAKRQQYGEGYEGEHYQFRVSWMPNGPSGALRFENAKLRDGPSPTSSQYEKGPRCAVPLWAQFFAMRTMWAHYDWYWSDILTVCEEAGRT